MRTNNSVLRFEPDSYDFSDYDYTEIYDMLYDKADRMLALLNEHNSENRAFRSKENVNLSTLRDELRNFRDVELEKFNAYVVQNNISKDRPAFVNKLSYLINHSTVTYRKTITPPTLRGERWRSMMPKSSPWPSSPRWTKPTAST